MLDCDCVFSSSDGFQALSSIEELDPLHAYKQSHVSRFPNLEKYSQTHGIV